jgi:hypothetical protein
VVLSAPNNHFSGGPAASPARIFGLLRQPRAAGAPEIWWGLKVGRETSARREGVADARERKETTRRRERHRGDTGGIVEARRRRNHRASGGHSPAECLESDSKNKKTPVASAATGVFCL